LTVVEKREIKKLIAMGFIVICCGGGGIPVIREGRRFHGVDAVIDKDLVSARLAEDIGADRFIIATDVPGLAVDYGQPKERYLETVTVKELEVLAQADHFPPGTVGPKVEAASAFVRSGGRLAVVCALDDIESAAYGKAGTRIVPA
jgi:carbamate kinase